MKTISALLFASLCSTSALACDRVDAARMQMMFAEMGAVWVERDGAVTVNWGWEWDGVAPQRRLALLQAFAAVDACLSAGPRPISFHRKGRLVGTAGPDAGAQLAGDAARARAAVAPVAAAAAECDQ